MTAETASVIDDETRCCDLPTQDRVGQENRGPQTEHRHRHRRTPDAGQRPGVTSEEAAEIKRLRAGNAELRRANEILKAASAFFAAELDRPSKRS
ncbi:hypothetical protein [Streptomyces sp. Ag109_O5-1]|uniref:hypothetical protein n=1 Tax=Streptomyces sp. Ag109_O5-1 TaxID=1938851 RepID=UPI000F4E1284|nr:hypothetical protein [Streptomyces sp. Ag109_O5-1]